MNIQLIKVKLPIALMIAMMPDLRRFYTFSRKIEHNGICGIYAAKIDQEALMSITHFIFKADPRLYAQIEHTILDEEFLQNFTGKMIARCDRALSWGIDKTLLSQLANIEQVGDDWSSTRFATEFCGVNLLQDPLPMKESRKLMWPIPISDLGVSAEPEPEPEDLELDDDDQPNHAADHAWEDGEEGEEYQREIVDSASGKDFRVSKFLIPKDESISVYYSYVHPKLHIRKDAHDSNDPYARLQPELMGAIEKLKPLCVSAYDADWDEESVEIRGITFVQGHVFSLKISFDLETTRQENTHQLTCTFKDPLNSSEGQAGYFTRDELFLARQIELYCNKFASGDRVDMKDIEPPTGQQSLLEE